MFSFPSIACPIRLALDFPTWPFRPFLLGPVLSLNHFSPGPSGTRPPPRCLIWSCLRHYTPLLGCTSAMSSEYSSQLPTQGQTSRPVLFKPSSLGGQRSQKVSVPLLSSSFLLVASLRALIQGDPPAVENNLSAVVCCPSPQSISIRNILASSPCHPFPLLPDYGVFFQKMTIPSTLRRCSTLNDTLLIENRKKFTLKHDLNNNNQVGPLCSFLLRSPFDTQPGVFFSKARIVMISRRRNYWRTAASPGRGHFVQKVRRTAGRRRATRI